MRTLRLSLAGTVILALLAGLGGAVLAQDEEAMPVTATYVTGNTTSTLTVSGGELSWMEGYQRDYIEEREMEWSDTRLPASMRLSTNWDYHPLASDELNGVISIMENVRLEDAVGAWTGMAYWMTEEVIEPETYRPTGLLLLEGEDAYEGLSAMLTLTPDEPQDWEGYIFGRELTPVPDLPAE